MVAERGKCVPDHKWLAEINQIWALKRQLVGITVGPGLWDHCPCKNKSSAKCGSRVRNQPRLVSRLDAAELVMGSGNCSGARGVTNPV